MGQFLVRPGFLSGRDSCSLGEVVDGGLVDSGCFAQGGRVRAGEFGESGSQDAVVDAGEEHGVAQAGGGDLVAVGVRDALDEAVLA